MTKQQQTRTINIDPEPKGKLRDIAGSSRDEWNSRIANLVASALPDHNAKEAGAAAISGMVDMKPADPVEGVLIAQLIAANEAALAAYRRAWAQPSEYFDARLKYLNIADKAARTVALLSERLDRHRTQGQQQITVKHVTVNAGQTVVTDTVVKAVGGNAPLASAKLLTTEPDNSFRMLDAKPEHEVVPAGRGTSPLRATGRW